MAEVTDTKARRLSAHQKNLVQLAADIWAAEERAKADFEADATAPERTSIKEEPWERKIDFHLVEAHQLDIDRRLRNWGIWCNGTTGSYSSPMFRLFVPTARAREYGATTADPVDRSDAIKIGRAVASLPRQHAATLHWAYVKPVSPRRASQDIGVTRSRLAELLRDARQMLINRGI